MVLSCGRDGQDCLYFTVADTGIGMSEGEVMIALEPFRQVDSSLCRQHEGTGLGLPLTKALVELHGGTLTIDSATGEGTTVTVTLPSNRLLPGWRAERTVAA